MKINNITALDYEVQGNLLVLVLANTSMEEVTRIDGSLLTVQTDDGDTVEVIAGYALRSVTYDLAAETYRAELVLAMEDTAAAAYAKLAGELEETQGKVTALEEANSALSGQLAELTGAIERGLTI